MEKIMNIDYVKKSEDVKNSIEEDDESDDFGKKKSPSNQSSKTPVLDTYSRDLDWIL